MLKNIRETIGRFFASDYIRSLEEHIRKAKNNEIFVNNKYDEIPNLVNARVAEIISQLDPVDLLLKEYNGVFSSDFTYPEERLNDQGKFGMYLWGWQQHTDPYFEHMVNFIMDSAGNQTMKGKILSEEDLKKKMLYGRAQIANMILLKKEVGRLASNYEDVLEKKRGGEDFDSSKTIEY